MLYPVLFHHEGGILTSVPSVSDEILQWVPEIWEREVETAQNVVRLHEAWLYQYYTEGYQYLNFMLLNVLSEYSVTHSPAHQHCEF